MKARLTYCRINVQQGIEGFELVRIEIRDQRGLGTAAGDCARCQPHALDHGHHRQQNPALPIHGDDCVCDHRSLVGR